MGAVKGVLLDLQNDINAYHARWYKQGIGEDDFFDNTTKSIAERLLNAAKERSPYMYGFLHQSHTLSREGSAWVIHLDPSHVNTILGGKPYQYGYLIHTEGRGKGGHRPWFQWAVEEAGDEAIFSHTGDLNSHFADVFTSQTFGFQMAAGVFDSAPSSASWNFKMGSFLNFNLDTV
jgi:hypothetical protein